jgi:hypothetical protein
MPGLFLVEKGFKMSKFNMSTFKSALSATSFEDEICTFLAEFGKMLGDTLQLKEIRDALRTCLKSVKPALRRKALRAVKAVASESLPEEFYGRFNALTRNL